MTKQRDAGNLITYNIWVTELESRRYRAVKRGITATRNKLIDSVIISVMRGLEHQMEEKQKHEDASASENNASNPWPLHVAEVVAGCDDVVCVLNPPSQHARVAVARAVEVGELEHASEDNTEGVETRSQY